MTKKKIILIVIASILGVIIIGALIFINIIKNSGKPDLNGEFKMKGLKDVVTVYRDSAGVAHIIAKNEEDLYRVTGYISAQDRMWQMDLVRRVTTGRLSEILGEDYVDTDALLRSLRLSEKSDKIMKTTSPEVISVLKAFSEGVNQYIQEDNLGFEFTILGYKPDLWKPEHSINLVGYMAWDLSMAWSSELTLYGLKDKLPAEKFNELFPDLNLQKTPVFNGIAQNFDLPKDNMLSAYEKVRKIVPEIINASNNWAVSGKKSVTGKPIFANDMHLGLMIPGVWSQIHQYIEGKIDVTGVILPGQPFVVAGHNQNIAWGMTNVMLDDIDFYVETVNPQNSGQYKFDGKWTDFIIKTEIIKDKKGNSVEKIIKYTHRGPVISEIKGFSDKVISMRWIGNENSDEVRTVYLLNRAKNWTDFRDAVKTFVSVSQNIAYADIEGNIGLQCCAGVPIRTSPGYNVFPGDTSLYDWKGIVPFDSLPYTYNPECGYIFSANNKTIGENFPHYISQWFDLPNRANRIEQMLKEKEKLSVEDFKKMHTDQKSLLAQEITPILLKSIKLKQNLSENEKKAVEILKKWDFVYTKESSAAIIFEEMYIILSKNIVFDEMGQENFDKFRKMDLLTNYLMDRIFKNGNSDWCDDIKTKEKEDLTFMINKSFGETIEKLSKDMGNSPEKWQWGTVHILKLQHPLGKVKILDVLFNLNREYSVGGSYHTVSPYSYDFNEPYTANHGASHRHIYSMADFDASYSIIPTGTSDVPGSEFYCNQTDNYIKGIYHEDIFSIEKVMKNAKYKAVFKP